MSRYRRNWKRSLKRYGMEDLGGPHLMRHTATLHWLQDLGFEFGRAQDRGRWLEEKSVRHYANPHMKTENLARLSEADRKRGEWLWEDPSNNFLFWN